MNSPSERLTFSSEDSTDHQKTVFVYRANVDRIKREFPKKYPRLKEGIDKGLIIVMEGVPA